MRGLMGKLNWATREGMPQEAGTVSLLSATMPTPKIRDISEANASLRRLLAHGIPIRICSIPLYQMKLAVFSDSSLHNAGGGSAQVAFMVCAADDKLLKNAEAQVGILTSRSHKMARAASATMNVEANALSEALAEAEWVATWFGLAQNVKYEMRKRDELNRDFLLASIISSDDSSTLDLAAITDAKSLYDNMAREQFIGAERMAVLEVCVIRDSLKSPHREARGITHAENPIECLT